MDDPPDRRFYFKVSGHENNDNIIQQIIMNYDLNNPTFQKDLGHLHIRLVLFLANHLDIASELPFEITNHPMNVYPTGHILPQSAPHLSLTGESIIFGGYMNDEYQKKAMVVHQIPHNDIAEQVNGVGELPCSVSNNPDLRDKFKPGSIIIPNTTRDIFVFNGYDGVGNPQKTIVKLEKNEMIVFILQWTKRNCSCILLFTTFLHQPATRVTWRCLILVLITVSMLTNSKIMYTLFQEIKLVEN
jgi:hypothetical protein